MNKKTTLNCSFGTYQKENMRYLMLQTKNNLCYINSGGSNFWLFFFSFSLSKFLFQNFYFKTSISKFQFQYFLSKSFSFKNFQVQNFQFHKFSVSKNFRFINFLFSKSQFESLCIRELQFVFILQEII